MANNEAIITGFVDPTCRVDFQPSTGKGYMVVSCMRFSGMMDRIIVEISSDIKGKFENWDYVIVKGIVRSRWGNVKGKRRKLIYLDANSVEADDHSDINQVELTGNICEKTKLRETWKTKSKICEFCIGVKRGKHVDYIPCIGFDENAEIVSKLSDTETITLAGRMQSRLYRIYKGNTYTIKTAYEVVVKDIKVE